MSEDQTHRFEYLSVMCNTLLLPLFTLVDRLLKVTQQSTPAKANERESAWAISAIAIAAVMLESWLVRAQKTHIEQQAKWQRSPLDFYNRLRERADLSSMPDITELFVVRDLIVHNHLYLVIAEYSPVSKLLEVELKQGGDQKFHRVVDEDTRKTRGLGLNVVPTRITRQDVAVFLRAMVSCLRALISADLLPQQALSDVEIFGANGRCRTLEEVVIELEASRVPMVD